MVAFGVNRGKYRDDSAIYLSPLFFPFPFFFFFFLNIDVVKSTVERRENF